VRPKKPKLKINPEFFRKNREFRDRYLEQVNEKGFKLQAVGKYELTRQSAHHASLPAHASIPLLEAA